MNATVGVQQPLTLGNLLPYDGIAEYLGPVLSPQQADDYFQALYDQAEWRNDQVTMFGNRTTMRRKYAWYGDRPYSYVYSGTVRTACPWFSELTALRSIVEQVSGHRYNSCLLNFYHDGDDAMGWHTDAEKSLQKHGTIASLSLGAERRFSFKHKRTKQNHSLLLQHGSLLVMRGEIQDHWKHSLPKSRRVHQPRINLTFRNMAE